MIGGVGEKPSNESHHREPGSAPFGPKLAELADLTGESMTAAVTNALRQRLDRGRLDRGTGLAARLHAIAEHCVAHLKEPWKSIDHGKLLYDDRALPK